MSRPLTERNAKVMLVNGLSKLLQDNGDGVDQLSSQSLLQDNLAFSFHTKMAADLLYPGYMRQMYLKAYRYSTFMLPKSLLLEVGAEGNTLQEAKDAMEPFAEILYTVLTGNG
ncbi:MAG: stage II sporulation protein P [Bianqueaceae bacterium]